MPVEEHANNRKLQLQKEEIGEPLKIVREQQENSSTCITD